MRRFAIFALLLAVGVGACAKSKSDSGKSSSSLTEDQRRKANKSNGKTSARKLAEARAKQLKKERASFRRLSKKWAAQPPALPPDDQKTRVTTDGLRTYVFSIGQADAVLVVGPPPAHKSLLVDLGSARKVPKKLGSRFSSYRRVATRIREITGRSDVDYFVVTHYDRDRTGRWNAKRNRGTGIIGLLIDSALPFAVGTLLDPGRGNSKLVEEMGASQRQLLALLPLLKKYKRVRDRKELQLGTQQIELGPKVAVEVVAAAGKLGPETNAFEIAAKHKAKFDKAPADDSLLSAALEISLGDFELFLAGDLPGSDKSDQRFFSVRNKKTVVNAEGLMVDAWHARQRESDVEVFFASAHGSTYSNSQKLLDALNPELVLYSAGDGRHPIRTVVRRAGKAARQLATTSVGDDKLFQMSNGKVVGEIEILVAADGKSYRVNGEPHVALSDTQESATKAASPSAAAPSTSGAHPAAAKTAAAAPKSEPEPETAARTPE